MLTKLNLIHHFTMFDYAVIIFTWFTHLKATVKLLTIVWRSLYIIRWLHVILSRTGNTTYTSCYHVYTYRIIYLVSFTTKEDWTPTCVFLNFELWLDTFQSGSTFGGFRKHIHVYSGVYTWIFLSGGFTTVQSCTLYKSVFVYRVSYMCYV